ncbi:cytochrome c oxidase subunit 7A, mitochondrial-like [Cydia splendana]|uniref:cytochrome c oxidase subunit 7A, mitochondrial-like n=1 Tax=Cydia splendana TaxID=1100963 RepID=UPI00212D89B6
MYHQLSRATGRLVAASNLQAPLFPIAPIALQRVEVPVVYNTTHMSTVTEAACSTGGKKRLVPGTNIPYPAVPENIRSQQAQFQKENDVPVFLKGGPLDAVLYRLTVALCLLGIVGFGHTIYSHAVKKN